MDRPYQMCTDPLAVYDWRDGDLAGQPSARVISGLFPRHDGIRLYSLPVLIQDHGQGRLWNDLVHRLADHRFPAEARHLEKSCVYRNETELTGFDSELENDVLDRVVDRSQLLFAFSQRSFGLFTFGDVDTYTDYTDRPAAVVEVHLAPSVQPTYGAV